MLLFKLHVTKAFVIHDMPEVIFNIFQKLCIFPQRQLSKRKSMNVSSRRLIMVLGCGRIE